ncbi:RluA family pseudouridine synthase [bacterium]|nr:MAG: RluA family pseudouridine synthase [bacterium]
MAIEIAYEDDWVLVVNKPAGLLTIPTPKNEPRTLTSILNQEIKDKNSTYNLYPCHRLDRNTSGLIIYAKGKSARDKFVELFRQRKVHKAYEAFVQGNLSKGEGQINNSVEGFSANTKYKVIQRKSNYTVVEAMPLTGRTNQLRIHFKQIGHPIVGEDKYAFRKDFQLRAKRLCLHAKKIQFMHPFTGKNISLEIGLTPDMQEFLKNHD